jgi:EAL domain-containing protein (putative c-di-GMP-specific phosphodiesterase class I)
MMAVPRPSLTQSFALPHYTGAAENPSWTAWGDVRCMLKVLRQLFPRQKADASADAVMLENLLERDCLELFYQPKIDLKTRRLTGAEGLIRGRHPTLGILSPAAFLPGAKEEALLALTERVIRMGLRDWEAFAAHGTSLKLSVNTPVSALLKLPMATLLREERPRGADWPGLILEVTEDEILDDLKIANEVADSLRAFNCTLALDDFGAGYSSLSRLRQLPFSELKIDRSYAANCHVDRFNWGLCETIIKLGRRFGLKTVAEGIETNHDAHKLQAIGCELGQGYLFVSPCRRSSSSASSPIG